WVDIAEEMEHLPLEQTPVIPNGWEAEHGKLPDISRNSQSRALKKKYNTFEAAHPAQIPPGETLYRILDPGSSDDSICWMREAEFLKLQSKAQWRKRFAVWKSWNRNGEYVTYRVPEGKPLNVWEGPAA